MAFPLIMEALARIEHKLDALLRWTGTPQPAPMHFTGQMCPACGALVDYQIDLTHGVVIRRCDCKTGKLPSTIPLTPVTQGKSNADSDHGSAAGVPEEAPDRPERRGR